MAARLKELKGFFGGDEDAQAERDALTAWQTANALETELRRKVKEADNALDLLAYNKYPALAEVEIKALVIDDKWLAATCAAVLGEMERISQTLTQRVKELAERYESSLPEQVCRVAELEQRVNRHLAAMGFAGN